MTPYKTINLSGCSYDARLFSRLIWQVLFDEYRSAGDSLDQMGDMLCDLYTLEIKCEQAVRFSEDGEVLAFRWYHYKSSTTIVSCDTPCWSPGSFRVEIDLFRAKINFYREAMEGT